ncbi:MAG TPA: energy transducer TonB [Acidobacteriaceae bacterium]
MKRVLSLFFLCLCGIFGNPARAIGQPMPQDCPTSVSPTGDVLPPLPLKKVNPQYPEVAQTHAVDGDVFMDIVIATDGSVRDIKVTHGLPQLIPNAIHAMHQWQYRPARMNGVAIACKTTIRMGFQIAASPAAAAAANAANNFAPHIPPSAEAEVLHPQLPTAPDGVLRVSFKAMETHLEKRVEPTYPADAVALDARGSVFLLVTVSKSGEVSEAQALTGPERFRDVASEAVKQWRFKPYEVDGEARVVQTTLILSFAPSK